MIDKKMVTGIGVNPSPVEARKNGVVEVPDRRNAAPGHITLGQRCAITIFTIVR